jgi:hypothetical protein
MNQSIKSNHNISLTFGLFSVCEILRRSVKTGLGVATGRLFTERPSSILDQVKGANVDVNHTWVTKKSVPICSDIS